MAIYSSKAVNVYFEMYRGIYLEEYTLSNNKLFIRI